MTKELEALKRMEYFVNEEMGIKTFKQSGWHIEGTDDYELVKDALQRLESIDNAKPSEALEYFEEMGKCELKQDCLVEDLIVYDTIKQALLKAQEQERLLKSGDLSDGYHTFNQLYYQRCILFASLVRLNKDKSWKSFKHSDGKYCFDSNGEWFIVGIDTPIGSYTYHFEKKYWDLFECQELDRGKEWDGHTEEDVPRLLSLPNEQEKVLKIVFEKNVNVYYFKDELAFWNLSYEYYINSFSSFHNGPTIKMLDEEEFELVKRWVENEQRVRKVL